MSAAVAAPREARGPGLLYGGLTIALVVAILMVALTAQTDSPPAIAEIAPQAVEQIKEAPQEQASDVGSGGTGAGGEGATDEDDLTATSSSTSTTTPEAGESTITRASLRRCVGDPPRQTEDPQSPPCVAFWEGDNGGATYQGVTGDEILVAVGNPSDAYPQSLWDALAAHFNKRYEFYGRRLRLQAYTTAAHGAGVQAMQADAAKVDDEMKAFAALNYSDQQGSDHIFFDELARRKVLSILQVSFGLPPIDQAHLRKNRPYQWGYTPTADTLLRHIGEMYCKNLAGKTAEHAGPPENGQQRKLGIIKDTTLKDRAPTVDLTPIEDLLQQCGQKAEVVEHQQGQPLAPILVNLRDKDVTTIMYTGPTPILSLYIMPAATQQGYEPEWIVSNFGHQDDDSAAQYFTPNQAQHVLGVQVYNKLQPNDDLPSTWAFREGDPTTYGGYGYHWIYEMVLVLASGIQMAGPNLTPETFEAGLHRARFPNPGAGAAPYYQATVGFPANTYSMVQDVTAIWLSPTERSIWTGTTPAYCYVGQGTRHKLGQWPKDIRFRTGACR